MAELWIVSRSGWLMGKAFRIRGDVRDEGSGAPHCPVGCDSLTGQGVFEYVGSMQDE